MKRVENGEVYISLVGLLGTHLHCIFRVGCEKEWWI